MSTESITLADENFDQLDVSYATTRLDNLQ